MSGCFCPYLREKPALKKAREILSLLCVFIIPFYFFRFSIFGIRTNILECAIILLLMVSLPFILKGKRLNLDREILNWFLPLFLLLIVLLSTLPAEDRIRALGIFKGWFLIPAIFAWLLEKNFNTKNIRSIAIPLYFSLLLVSVWVLLQKSGYVSTLFYQTGDGNFSRYLLEKRFFGPFESPNYLAMFLVPSFFISLSLAQKVKIPHFTRNLFFLSLALPLIALHFSGSRAGLLALFFGSLVYLNYRYVNTQKSSDRKPFFWGAFILLFITINSAYLFFASRFFKPEGSGDKIRVEIYQYSIEMVKDNFLSGVGLGNFINQITRLSEGNTAFQVFALPFALHSHNLFMTLWLNIGLFGLLAFILIIAKFYSDALKTNSPMRAVIMAAMTAILFHGLFDTTYFKNDLSAIFWLLIAISLVLKKENEKDFN